MSRLLFYKYCILENNWFLLITGDVGTGKTALIRAVEREVGAHSIVVNIPDPGMDLMDFYNFMASELKIERRFKNKGEFLIHFKRGGSARRLGGGASRKRPAGGHSSPPAATRQPICCAFQIATRLG